MPPPLPSLRWVHRAARGIRADERLPRLGVLGGTFNPVTRAHLELAEAARREFSLSEVLFLLPEKLPHRAPEEATLEERLALLEAALAPEERFSLAVCSHGLFLEMAEAVVPHYPPSLKLFFLAGSDAAERILGWDYPEPDKALARMFARFDLIVASRRGRLALPEESRGGAYRKQIHRLQLPENIQEISATGVRERLRAGQPIDDLVPAAVAEALRRAGFYRP